jgi:glycosyltransferase involved in cell wall biosynthesis
VKTEVRLAIVGDAPYAADYIRRLRQTADRRIVFPGAVYGKGYQQLRAHALAYVHATEVGGTHPALIEAMAARLPVLYLDTPENREVAGDAGIPFAHSEDDLAARLSLLLGDAAGREELACRAGDRARRFFDWETVTTAYERLFEELRRRGR